MPNAEQEASRSYPISLTWHTSSAASSNSITHTIRYRTYLLEDSDKDVTVAYYSLLADKISFNPEEKSAWNKINRNIPNNKRRKNYPAVKIGRLAVNEDYAGCGLGSMIIRNIMYTFTQVKRLGCRFLTVDALRSATSFYEKCGFKFFTEEDKDDETRLMFFDLKNFTE